jgi:protein disulfide-isomerase A1
MVLMKNSIINFVECSGFPTLKLFLHGVPVDYTGPRKAELLTNHIKKLASPNVTVLESDASIKDFEKAAGSDLPLFIGFGLEEVALAKLGGQYKKTAWFSVAKDYSEEIMVSYDFDKFPALVSLYPKYNERNVFYGPFKGMLCTILNLSYVVYMLALDLSPNLFTINNQGVILSTYD